MKQILVVRTDRVGDVVYITPAIRELRRTFPDAYIATLTQPHTKNILLHNPHLNAMITDDLRKESFWDVIKEIRRHKFTHALLMMPFERAAYQLFLAGIPRRIGVGHKLYELITFMRTVSRNNYIPLRHESDYCMDLARKIGVQPQDHHLEMFVTDEERRSAEVLLHKRGSDAGELRILLHSGSFGSAPNWSEEKYFQLIETMINRFEVRNIKIFLTAKEMSDDFLSMVNQLRTDRVVNIVSEVEDLRTFITVIGQMDIVMGPSTGPLHIGDALNVSCIGLHCHRPMNCPTHQGILNGRSINLEVSEEYCMTHCSADYKQCAFEDGIAVGDALSAVETIITKYGKNIKRNIN